MNTKIKNIFLILTFIAITISIGLFLLNDKTKSNSKDFAVRPQIGHKISTNTPIGEVSDMALEDEHDELTFPNNTLDTSDWETYQTNSFGIGVAIEIRYPEDWKIKPYGSNQEGLVTYDKRVGRGADNGIYMMVEKMPIEKYLAKNKHFSEYRKIKMNDLYGYELISEAQTGLLTTSVALGNNKRNRTYIFNALGPDPKDPSNLGDYSDVFQQILLSFKLIK